MTDPLRDRLAAALGPNYELQRLLGKGGMGSVYLAREAALDRLVAVKVLPPEVTGDPETRERFRREARTAAKLTHPHIVPLYSFGESEGLLWFVMGYVAGETLASKLERSPRLDPEIVRRVLADIADALDYAHGHGIVHRDVKPENILIEDAGGKALLADFGVARAGTGSTTLTTAGALVGTPLYMSPEQASGERDLDGRSDIYSLGIVGYRMLAGRTPFEGGELRAVLAAHIAQTAPALPSDVPEDLDRTVLRALAKNSIERWGSGREMREALGATDVVTADELDRLGTLPGILTGGLFITAGAGLLWSILHFGRPAQPFWDDPINLLVYFLGGVMPLLPISVWLNSRRMKIPLRRALRIAMWPPESWTGVWPASWRRPGDLWSRLPWVVRRARVAVSISVLGVIPLLAGMVLQLVRHRTAGVAQPLSMMLPLAAASIVALQAWAYVTSLRYGKAQGLNSEAASRLIVKPTWNDPFWKKPEIARLLAPIGTAATQTEGPRTPGEMAVGVRQIAGSLPSHHAALAQEAVAHADAIAQRIGRLDTELATLAQEVQEADIASVERKLADLGSSKADEPASRREIRQMHQQQLELLRRLQQQVVDGQARREQLAGLLRTLYLQVSELKVETKRLTEADTSGVRSVVDRMAREVEGLREVNG